MVLWPIVSFCYWMTTWSELRTPKLSNHLLPILLNNITTLLRNFLSQNQILVARSHANTEEPVCLPELALPTTSATVWKVGPAKLVPSQLCGNGFSTYSFFPSNGKSISVVPT